MIIFLSKMTVISLMVTCSFLAVAETEPSPVTQEEIKEVTQSMASLLKTNYVYPEKAKKMASLLTNNYANGKYNKIKDVGKLVDVLQKDINSIYHDKHLRVIFDPENITRMRAAENAPEDTLLDVNELREMQRDNYGFKEVKLLSGNLGYLDLRGFYPTSQASETAVAAMNFLSNADALIIDLRNNGGGSPTMIQLISSYLFGPDPVHLSGFYWRPDDKYTQNWTLPYVPGKRRPDIDVYILTSDRTFSAAEEFSYNLKHLKRATLIGETTGGGAHPGGDQIVTDRFLVWLPSGRSTNPITNTNWEGVGVKPNVQVPTAKALLTAQKMALEKLAEKEDEADNIYQWHLTGLKAELNPVQINQATLKKYVGEYGNRTLSYENGNLYYQRAKGVKYKLKALDKHLFSLPDLDFFRLKILVENNEVIGLQGLYDNGSSDQSLKQ
jgi:C-terminal processing protease CtpA/Prc